MKFSIIVPTKNRQITAIQAIKSCSLSNYKNIEIIVSDVSNDDSLKSEIKKFKDSRIRYFYHSQKLSMKENWEFAVSASTGDYVSVIGDDDALMPDGFLFASEILKIDQVPVLHCNPANYKWPDYPLINRINYIGLKVPTTIIQEKNPRGKLRKAYGLKERFGTGPGIYYGLISREFLERLKSKRGSYFIDESPDFDSGFCTFLYAERYLQTTYPIFVSGHSGASNSGRMRFGATKNKSALEFLSDISKKTSEVFWSDLAEINSLDVAIISAMKNFLPEVNREIDGKKIKLDRQSVFDFIAPNFSAGYDTTTFKVETNKLKKIAKKWNVSPQNIPKSGYPAHGLIADKGVNSSSITGTRHVYSLVIDGNELGVNGILDASKIIQSSTTNWATLLHTLKIKKLSVSNTTREQNKISLDLAVDYISEARVEEAVDILRNNIMDNPIDTSSLSILGLLYFNEKNFNEAIPILARSLSFSFNIKTFDAYFRSLISTHQYNFASQVLENYSEELNKSDGQLFESFQCILEIETERLTA